jgi:hypothetical protein
MKKLVYLLMALFVISNSSFAQKKAGKKEGTAPAKTEAKAPEMKAEKAPSKPGNAAAKTKKDGTPDMRHKENKDAAKKKPEGPMKKDGTPDMRHKANKEAAKKK